MPATGFQDPGTGADDDTVGSVAWANPGNIVSSNDVRAIAAGLTGTTSHYLKATNFGFSIPVGNEILGVELAVERRAIDDGGCPAASEVADFRVHLVIGGVIQSSDDNKAKVDIWGASDATANYGGVADIWGQAMITAAQANASDFGSVISCSEGLGETADAEVDHMQMQLNHGFDARLGPAVFPITSSNIPSGLHEEDDDLRPVPYFRKIQRWLQGIPEKRKLLLPAEIRQLENLADGWERYYQQTGKLLFCTGFRSCGTLAVE